MKSRRLTRPLLFVIAVASALALSAPARADVGTVAYTGSAIGDQTITGTFTLDHFTVKTKLPDSFANPPGPQLIAVGTVTGQVTGPFGDVSFTFDDAPFDWVNLTVVATCGDRATVTFGNLSGSDYVDLHDQPLWDPSVPIPVWNASRSWGVTVTSPPLALTGNGGLACAIAQAISRDDLSVEATLLNALLRQQ